MRRTTFAPLDCTRAAIWTLLLASAPALAGTGATATAAESATWRIDVRIFETGAAGEQLLTAPTVMALAGQRAEIAIGSEQAAGPPDGPPWFVGTRCTLRVVESPAGQPGPPRLEAQIRTSRLEESPAGPRLNEQAIRLYAPLEAGQPIKARLAPTTGSNVGRRVEIRAERVPPSM